MTAHWLMFAKNIGHAKACVPVLHADLTSFRNLSQAVSLGSKWWVQGIMPKGQKVGSSRTETAINLETEMEQSRDWGHSRRSSGQRPS